MLDTLKKQRDQLVIQRAAAKDAVEMFEKQLEMVAGQIHAIEAFKKEQEVPVEPKPE